MKTKRNTLLLVSENEVGESMFFKCKFKTSSTVLNFLQFHEHTKLSNH